jgi:hypothetical protein
MIPLDASLHRTPSNFSKMRTGKHRVLFEIFLRRFFGFALRSFLLYRVLVHQVYSKPGKYTSAGCIPAFLVFLSITRNATAKKNFV